MARIDLIFNPVSGSFRQRRLDAIALALKDEGFAVTVLATTAEGVRFSGAADIVVIHGGDGTVRDVVGALGERAGDVALAVAPSGTINLVARELGFSPAPATFAHDLAASWRRGAHGILTSPLFRVGRVPMVSCLSIGPDSHAVAKVSGALKRRMGRYAYVAAFLRQMRDWPRESIGIEGELSDGTPFECEAEAVIVSHAALYAGPFRLSPDAALHTDTVELITLDRSTRSRMMRLSGAAMMGLSLQQRGLAQIRTCRRIVFDHSVTPMQVDGDPMPDAGRVIEPSGLSLRYLVPPRPAISSAA